MVAATMGPAGALIATKNGVVLAPSLKLDARSTVGAGDSFLGARLCWQLPKGNPSTSA